MTPKELIADIKQGLRHGPDRLGVNGVTGDYSRGASGFWIENGEITYPVSGHDRGPSAADVQIAGRGQRSGVPLRRQRADAAYRGPDAWRTLKPPTDRGARCRAADRYGARSRCAGAVAVSYRIEELDQGRFLAGFRGRHRRQRPRGTKLRSATPDYGWLSEERRRRRARLRAPLVWIVDPIDGTRAYLAGREDWCVSVALVAGSTPVLAAVFAPATDEFFFAMRGQGTTQRKRPVRAAAGPSSIFPAWQDQNRWCSG